MMKLTKQQKIDKNKNLILGLEEQLFFVDHHEQEAIVMEIRELEEEIDNLINEIEMEKLISDEMID